jgi:hypothetical protein
VVASSTGTTELENGDGGRCAGSAGLWAYPNGNHCLPPPLTRGRSGTELSYLHTDTDMVSVSVRMPKVLVIDVFFISDVYPDLYLFDF